MLELIWCRKHLPQYSCQSELQFGLSGPLGQDSFGPSPLIFPILKLKGFFGN